MEGSRDFAESGEAQASRNMPGGDGLLAAMFSQAGDAAFALDLQGRFLPTANERFEAETGYAIAEVAGKHFSCLLADGEAARVTPLFERTVCGEHFDFVEVEIVRRSGERVWAELSGAPLHWQGRVAGIVCIGRNATQRIRRLIDVVRLERVHEAIVNAVRTGIVVVTSELTVAGWNAYMRQWLGVSQEEAIGRRLCDLFPGLWSEGLESWMRAALESGTPHTLSRWEHRSHYGERDMRYVDVRVQALDDPESGKRLALLIFDDVTDRVALEDERLTSERLMAIAQTAAKANHEINNPLAALLGNVEILQRTPGLDARLQRRLGRIVESIDRVTEVVHGLAQTAKPAVAEALSNGRVPLDVSVERRVPATSGGE